MKLSDLVNLAQKSLRSNLLRSILTSLGIIIGVSSVITMMSIGSAAKEEVTGLIDKFGSNNLILRAQTSSRGGVSMGSNSANTLDLDDMNSLKDEIPSIIAIAPQVSLSTQVLGNDNNWLSSVTGSTNDYFLMGNWSFDSGRHPTPFAVVTVCEKGCASHWKTWEDKCKWADTCGGCPECSGEWISCAL